MIPILFEKDDRTFTTNGLGRLTDAISCKVVEERNGSYELTMVYPVTGIHYEDLIEDRIILAKPNETSANQAFRIYSIEKPFNGKVTVYAEHISYLLNAMTVKPFTAGSCQAAISLFASKFVTPNAYFTFTTDKEVVADFELTEPKTARAVLGGTEGSFLDVFGTAEYEFDNFNVKMWQNRGSDKGVTIRYGKNLTDITSTTDDQSSYAGIVPYWKGRPDNEDSDAEDVLVTLTEYILWSAHQWDFAYPRVIPVDFSSDFESQPTEGALRAVAQRYLAANEGWNKKKDITVNFVALWQTEEYKDVANLEKVSLCDTVTVIYPDLGVTEKLKVKQTDYNVLLERYNSISLGDSRTSLVSEVTNISESIDERIKRANAIQRNSFQKAIDHATELIKGGLGGYVVLKTNADGEPEEILILGPESHGNIEDAQYVIRMNYEGIAFSNEGYDPDAFETAWTIDGAFNANFISSGAINAGLITTGVLMSEQNPDTWWDLAHGDLHLGTGVAQEVAEYVDASGRILSMPYILRGNVAHFTARLFKGEYDITQTYPEASYTWYKKEDYKITYVGCGYTFPFDLSLFKYGGSVILQFEETAYQYITDSEGHILMDDDGHPLVVLSNHHHTDLADLLSTADEGLLSDDDEQLLVLTSISESDMMTVETDFTNGTRVSALEVTTDGLLSRVNKFNGTSMTMESVFSQTAENIRLEVSEFESRTTVNTRSSINQLADSITLNVQSGKGLDGNTDLHKAAIRLSVTKAGSTSSEEVARAEINLNGLVTFTNLGSTDTTTHIDGGHIFGGTLSLGGKSATKGNGSLKIYNSNDVEIGSWTSAGLVVTNANNDIRTTLVNGQLHVWRYVSSAWKEIGNMGHYSNMKITKQDSNGSSTQNYDVFGINALSTSGEKGLALCVDGVPYYALNLSNSSSQGMDLTGYGFRHYFRDSVYCEGTYKTYCGYGWTGNYGADWWVNGQPEVATGGNVRIWSFDGYGKLTVEGGIYYWNMFEVSDRRQKHDIIYLDVSESRRTIMGLKPVSYRYNASPDVLHHGFIAQEVDEIAPWDVQKPRDGDGTMTISYQDFIADLVKVVQDQERRIEQLERSLN